MARNPFRVDGAVFIVACRTLWVPFGGIDAGNADAAKRMGWRLAERVGFEPTVVSLPRRFSSANPFNNQ